jgi:hypothetical protein
MDCLLCGARIDGSHECAEQPDEFGEWDGDQVDAVADDVREVFSPTPAAAPSASAPPAGGVGSS